MVKIIHCKTKSDIADITYEIKKATWSKNSEIDPEEYSTEAFENFIASDDRVLCVGCIDDEFAGMASAHLMYKPSGDRWLYIDEVDVCENQQRKGVGRAMMEWLLKFAKDNGCIESWLGTEVDNIPANSLYKSLNPDEVNTFVGYNFVNK